MSWYNVSSGVRSGSRQVVSASTGSIDFTIDVGYAPSLKLFISSREQLLQGKGTLWLCMALFYRQAQYKPEAYPLLVCKGTTPWGSVIRLSPSLFLFCSLPLQVSVSVSHPSPLYILRCSSITPCMDERSLTSGIGYTPAAAELLYPPVHDLSLPVERRQARESK